MLGLQRIILLLVFVTPLKFIAQSTASQQVTSFEIELPQVNEKRTIWVYLPKNYETSDLRYPVTYMFDGQNVFDDSTAYAREWKVDEYLDQIDGEHIVVAIAHGNENRINELTPFNNNEYGGGGGDEFLEFIITELKPHIDKYYRTLSDRYHTTIAGASLGGLMAYYAAVKYSIVFSKAIVLSPSFWINPEMVELTNTTEFPEYLKLYIVIGADEGELMLNSYEPMLKALIEKKLPVDGFYMELVEGGVHNEEFWSKQYARGFEWLQQ